MSPKILRLISGEEIVCTYETNSSGDYILKNVVQAISTVTPERKMQVSFVPFCPVGKTEDGFVMNKAYVAFAIDPIESVKSSYVAVFNISSAPSNSEKVDNTVVLKSPVQNTDAQKSEATAPKPAKKATAPKRNTGPKIEGVTFVK
jgi:hypothetical protein